MKATIFDEELAVIAHRVRARRRFLGLTQKELSKHVGVDPSAVSLWERGSTTPGAIFIPRIAKALECSADYLLGLTDEPDNLMALVERAAVLKHIRNMHYATPAVRDAMELLMDSLAQGCHLSFDER